MNHIVSFSTGLSSAICVERVAQKYGRCYVVFEDTTIEDADNYRFKREMNERWTRLYDVVFVDLCDGRNPYQVAEDHHIIPNQKIAPCTRELKINPFLMWLLFTFPGRDATIYIGYDYTEAERCEPTRRGYAEAGYTVDFPLLWKPYELRPYTDVARRDWGIEPPVMYSQGYSHGNCGGRCVKQGVGDWIRTLIYRRDSFLETEEWEQTMRQHPTRKNYALCRDQSGGKVRALTLREIRERYEAGTMAQLSLLDYQAPCVHCGVGGVQL